MIDIIHEFRSLPTTCISDALGGLKHLNPAIKPLKEEYKICGRAVTVKMPAGDNMMVLAAMKEANPGDILVIDSETSKYRSFAGEFVISLAQTLDLGGIIADGTVRDIVGIKALNFPVFCTGITVACSDKFGKGSVNVPISCGGVPIFPNDIVVGDADGVVIIPTGQAEQVLAGAKDKMNKDIKRAEYYLQSRERALSYIENVLLNSQKA